MLSRGEVWWVTFASSIGTEIQKTRPSIIVSANAANRHLSRVVVVPLTSNTQRVHAGQALITLNGKQSKALADQITTADKSRLLSHIGRLGHDDMEQVDQIIRTQLSL